MNLPERKLSASANDVEISTFRRGLSQFVAVAVKNLVLFGYGMTLGFPTIVIPAIQGGEGRKPDSDKAFSLTEDQISWFSSINLLCVPLGCFLSGMLTEPTGKKRAMQLVNIPMFAAWLIFYFSSNIYHLYAGLCLAGLSGGLMEAPVLTYVAEVTQPEFRGMLAATGTTCVIIGIFCQFVMGTFMTWRTVALVCSALPLLTILALCFVPESPYWLLTKGRVDEARESLAWLRGWAPFSIVKKEFDEISEVLSKKKIEADALADLSFYHRFIPYTKQSFIVPFTLVSATFFIGHFSGKTPLQTYAVQIFHTLKVPIDKYYATILLGAAELIGAVICVFLVHLTGKRPLVFTSLIGCGLCFLGAATYTRYLDLVPGVTVDNVVANASMLDTNKANIISDKNVTEALNNFLSKNGSFSLEFPVEMTTEYDDFGDKSTITATETTTAPFSYNEFSNNEAFQKRFRLLQNKELANHSDNSATLNDKLYEPETIPISDAIILSIPNNKPNKLLWLPLTLLLGSALFAHMGIRLIPWMLIGEVYPVNVRSGASGLSSGIGYIFGFLANKLFLRMVATMTLPGTFWFYSSIAIIGCIILYFTLPETEGKSLLEIEEYFSGKKLMTDTNSNGCNTHTKDNDDNHRVNGFDHITVIPQSVKDNSYQQITIAFNPTVNNYEDVNHKNDNGFNDLPEIVVSTPRAGSKRFIKPTRDSQHRRSSSRNEDDSTDL